MIFFIFFFLRFRMSKIHSEPVSYFACTVKVGFGASARPSLQWLAAKSTLNSDCNYSSPVFQEAKEANFWRWKDFDQVRDGEQRCEKLQTTVRAIKKIW